MAPRNTLSNLAKRNIAFSGRADIGDAPDLYGVRDAMARARQAEMGGTAGLAAGSGGSNPLPTGVGGGGGGGLVSSAPDVGLPGAGFQTPELERYYTRAFRKGGEGEMRGALADRGALNVDPADPFGLDFAENLETVTGIASLLGIPGMGMANTFVQLALKDAQLRSDDFFEGLIFNELGIPASGASIGGGGLGGFDVGGVVGAPGAEIGPGGTLSQTDPDPGAFGGGGGNRDSNIGNSFGGGGIGVGSGGGLSQTDPDPGAFSDRGGDGPSGDAGSGGGGQSDAGGSGGGVCFASGTLVLMGDGSEKAIETLSLGDRVMGFNEGGPVEPCEVIACFAHRSKPVWRLNGSTLVTPGHRFYSLRDDKGYGFWPLEEIPLGAMIMLADGSSRRVETIEDAGEQRDVFNITVQGMHTYIADGYRVHNIKHMGGYISESRVPGQRRGDVDEILQEGEFVLTADAVDMAGGPAFFDGMNAMARLMRGRK